MKEDQIIWLSDFPKSGIGWLRHFLDAYDFGDVLFPKSRIRMDDLTAYLWQRVAHRPLPDLKPLDAIWLRPAVLQHLIETAESPRLVKTHTIAASIAGIPGIPAELTDKAVHIIRDPRDIACSYAAYIGANVDDVIRWMGMNDHVLAKDAGLFHYVGTWSDHIRAWSSQPFPVHMVRYEDIHADPIEQFSRIVEFLSDDKADLGRVTRAVEMTDFQRMQKREREEGTVEANAGGVYFRAGKPGGWKDELTDEQVARIEADHGEVMAEWGYELVNEIKAIGTQVGGSEESQRREVG